MIVSVKSTPSGLGHSPSVGELLALGLHTVPIEAQASESALAKHLRVSARCWAT